MKEKSSLSSQLRDLGVQITSAQKFWLASAGIALGTLFLGNTLIQTPWQERRRQIASRYGEEQQRLELVQALQRQNQSLQQKEKGLLLEGGAPVLTSHISRIAAQSAVEIESVTPQAEASWAPYTKYQIEVIAQAKLKDLTLLLHAIEQHRPVLIVDEVEVETVHSADFQGLYYPTGKGAPQEGSPKTSERIQDSTRRVRFLISSYGRKGGA
ncbi:MAG: hypothetical protein HYZ88_01600 [Candidatus Omnitrophica bacterium]|nr:hypothetical protein [Candidatus Omnitrophota bacterium]